MADQTYLSRAYQPYFGFGDTGSVARQAELEDQGLLPSGYVFDGGHYFWNAAAEHTTARIGDFLYRHSLSRYQPEDVEGVEPRRRVFVLGGSLAVGTSATDKQYAWHAVLEKLLCERFPAWSPRVFNCAMGAFVTTQELLALVLAVLPRQPHGVIFLNGLNDIYQPWQLGVRPGDPYNLSTVMKYWYERPFIHGQSNPEAEASLLRHTNKLLRDPEKREIVKRSTANVYFGNMTQCIRLCQAVGVKVAVCFQPWLEMSRRHLGLDFLYEAEGALANEQTFELIRDRMTASHPEFFHDLTRIFDYPDQLARYTDVAHLHDHGQERLGQAVAAAVEPWVRVEAP